VKTRTSFARAAASVFLASALVVGTAGCTFITPQATLNRYDPADGLSADLGDLQLRNVVAIASEDGKSLSLLLAVINTGAGPHSLNIQYQAGGKQTTVSTIVPANSTASFGNTPEQDQIIITNSGASAGGLVPVYFQYGTIPGTQLLVPVLDATLIYSDLAPRATN
jgi:hypothetical protein